MRNGKIKAVEWKFSDIERQVAAIKAFVDTFSEDNKEVLSYKFSQMEKLNIKYELVRDEIFTSPSHKDFDSFNAKITNMRRAY
ncbi:hypothetical protein TNCV_3166931 [Trichonephila clavipes]|uniref:Uncharacterized protein n=1 Tax=Trichonephila clavipes TaxID=2585209 RepID=A0A8X6RE24_TRICX|nr:hypothetical protein TNCV_3166931 [Trichonephila clavipes]